MTATDLIRLAEELARCGGVHRLTNLITAAVHVTLEHERGEPVWEPILWQVGQPQPRISDGIYDGIRLAAGGGYEGLRRVRRRTVEAWEDGPEVGVGMSDKVARDLTLEIHDDAQRALRDRPPRYRPQAPSRAPERDGECGGPGGPGTDRGALAGSGAPPVAVSPNWGFAIVNNNVLRSNPAPVMPERGERKPLPQSDCQDERPRGGISHEPGSPLLKAQDDFGRRERLVPKFDGKRINPEDLGDGA